MRKIGAWIGLALFASSVTGCATTGASKVGQSDIDALNARLSALQAQLSDKDAEIAKLRNQMKDEEAARVQAENDKESISRKLDTALSEIQSAKKRASKPAAVDPDLK
jgi:chromosome segregation ATPase